MLGLVNGTQREPLSEKLPFQRAPELVLQVSPSQLVWLSSTAVHFMRAGRPSMLHAQAPPHQPVTMLAGAGPDIAKLRTRAQEVVSSERFISILMEAFLIKRFRLREFIISCSSSVYAGSHATEGAPPSTLI